MNLSRETAFDEMEDNEGFNLKNPIDKMMRSHMKLFSEFLKRAKEDS